jgi:hypothetical protein
MRDIDTQFPVYTDDLDASLLLVLDSQEIAYILSDIGADFDAGSLLVDTRDGEYTQVWGALTSVPRTDTRWFDLLD